MLGLAPHRLFIGKARRATPAAALARERCAARSQPSPAEGPAEPGSRGWFDSSHALLEGLTVVEYDDAAGRHARVGTGAEEASSVPAAADAGAAAH